MDNNSGSEQKTEKPVTYSNQSSKSKLFLAVLIIIVILVLSFGIFGYFYSQKQLEKSDQNSAFNKNPESYSQTSNENSNTQAFEKLTEPKLLFTGGYADPTIATLFDGSLIMYINNFSSPPVKYEAHTSADGITWNPVSANLPDASTGRAVKFGGQIRLYYPDKTPIRPTDPPASILSAISDNGINFVNENGTRVDPQEGFYLEGPTVFELKDGSYRMYFSENETQSAEKRISKIWGAASQDGLAWTRDDAASLEATVEDERIPADWPQALHPFVLTRSDGSYLMFYNTHSEVYAAHSTDGINWIKKGSVNIHGADVDGYYLDDNTIRLYYGDFSPETKGVVYTIDIKESL
jgi:hypothetical protein